MNDEDKMTGWLEDWQVELLKKECHWKELKKLFYSDPVLNSYSFRYECRHQLMSQLRSSWTWSAVLCSCYKTQDLQPNPSMCRRYWNTMSTKWSLRTDRCVQSWLSWWAVAIQQIGRLSRPLINGSITGHWIKLSRRSQTHGEVIIPDRRSTRQ